MRAMGAGLVRPVREGLPAEIVPAVVADLDAIAAAAGAGRALIECVQDRIAIEIMRGCPGKCRFCQSTTLKRPLRFRKVETIVAAAHGSSIARPATTKSRSCRSPPAIIRSSTN